MRAVDFWIGVPLCFLLTLVARLQRLFGLAAEPTDGPRKILFIQLAEMGTMVVAYPAFRKARELFPAAELHILCFQQIRSSVEILDLIPRDRIHTIEADSLWPFLRDTLLWPWRARRLGVDPVVNLEAFVRYSSLLSFLSGARRRVGFHRFNQEGLYTGDLVTHKVLFNSHIHTAHIFLDLVQALAAPANEVPRVNRPKALDRLDVPKITTDAATAERIWTKLRTFHPDIGPSRKVVILNPNASERFPMRRVPLDGFVDLAKRLLQDPDVFVLVTGVRSEKAEAQQMRTRAGSPRVLDLTGETTLQELLHVFDLAHVMVSNDSGPAHFAALTRVHVIVFFGPEIPERYRPLATSSDVVHTGFSCSPCIGPYNQRLSPCNDNLCLKTIDIPAVCDLVRRRLAQAAAPAEHRREAAEGGIEPGARLPVV
jgi:ADP-heptose:LPS heptosyltransferase